MPHAARQTVPEHGRPQAAAAMTTLGSPLDEIDRLERELAQARRERDIAIEALRDVDRIVRDATFTPLANI